MIGWFIEPVRHAWKTEYYVFESIAFPDGVVLYHFVGNRSAWFADPQPRASFSVVELINIYVGRYASVTGKFTAAEDTHWDPWGREAFYSFITAPWQSNAPWLIYPSIPPLPEWDWIF